MSAAPQLATGRTRDTKVNHRDEHRTRPCGCIPKSTPQPATGRAPHPQVNHRDEHRTWLCGCVIGRDNTRTPHNSIGQGMRRDAHRTHKPTTGTHTRRGSSRLMQNHNLRRDVRRNRKPTTGTETGHGYVDAFQMSTPQPATGRTPDPQVNHRDEHRAWLVI